MMGKTHTLIGAVAGLGMAVYFHMTIPETLAMTALATVGALVPDVDHPKGTIRRKLGVLGWVFALLPHRGPTHSLLAAGLIGVWIYILSSAQFPTGPVIFGAFSFGYLSHLVADMCTVEGIPLFFPVSNRYFSLLPIRTGGLLEQLVFIAVAAGGGYLVYLLLT